MIVRGTPVGGVALRRVPPQDRRVLARGGPRGGLPLKRVVGGALGVGCGESLCVGVKVGLMRKVCFHGACSPNPKHEQLEGSIG